MSDTPLTLVAEFQALPGKEDELRRELQALVAPTRSESGCLDYFLHESPEQTGHFLFYENWTSDAALAEHARTPYLQRIGSLVPELCTAPPRLVKLRRIA